MSIAGVRSSQGDSFQSLVAVRYAVEMIYTTNLREIEVDSTSLDPSGKPAVVDDIIVRYDDSTLYIQAKKNQPEFRAWTISDLGDELKKAWIQWRRDPEARLLFISRNNFGDVWRLREYAGTQPTPAAFDQSLTANLRDIAKQVAAFDDRSGTIGDLYLFLLQLDFETINIERFRSEILGQLRLHVAHGQNAFERIKARIDAISRRETQQGGSTISPHSLTRRELFELLRQAGIEVCVPKSEHEAITSLSRLSAIGRNWQRKIGDIHLARPVVAEISDRVSHRPSCLLLSADPGIGKTCVLLSVLERLEHEALALPVFIQAREFATARTVEEREALGLPSTLVTDVARLSEARHVVVLIDSIDVLSIARDHHGLSFVLSLVDRLRLIPDVTVIATCRSFDLKYDLRLADRDWGEIVAIPPLDWDAEIEPLLAGIKVDPNQVAKETRELLRNPRLLAIFHDIVRTGSIPIARSSQELTEHYLRRVVSESPTLGDPAMKTIMGAARWMLDNRRLDIPQANVPAPEGTIRALLSAGVLVETHQRGFAFGHQTLLDVLAVAHANASGETLAVFIRTRAAAPFIRPTVRAFLFSLRMDNALRFRQQVREVVDADDIAFHLRRLVAESLAEVTPTTEDWPLIRHLYTTHPTLFNEFYKNVNRTEWIRFFHLHWLSLLISKQDGPWLIRLLEPMAACEDLSEEFINLWRQAFEWSWVDQQRLHWFSSRLLDRFSNWATPGVRQIFEKLVSDAEDDHGSLGKPLSKWILATDANDDLLWHYITRRIEPCDFDDFQFGRKLECQRHHFLQEDFLGERLQSSEALMDLALDDLEIWSERRRAPYEADADLAHGFLRETRYGRIHSTRDMHHVDGLTILLSALEGAIKHHASSRTSWWYRNVARLRCARDAALRFFVLQALTENPEAHASDASALLLDGVTLNFSHLRWEVGLLLNAAFPFLTPEQQETVQGIATTLDDDDRGQDGGVSTWRILARRELLAHIPSCYRTVEAQAIIDLAELLDGPFSRCPTIQSWGGLVGSPVSRQTIFEMSDEGLIRLLRYYSLATSDSGRWERSGSDGLVGGAEEVVRQLQEAASRQPLRFMRFYETHGHALEPEYVEAVLAGIAMHLRYRFGNLGSSEEWTAIEEPDGALAADWLLRMAESRYDFWVGRRDFATILQASAAALHSDADCERISFLLLGCLKSDDPGPERDDSGDRITVAINSTRGVAAETAFAIAGRRLESERGLPRLLVEILRQCASDQHPSVRALVLRSLPVVIYYHSNLGWHLFEHALFPGNTPPWRHAYDCLYYNYHRNFSTVNRYLAILRVIDDPEALKIWSRICALSCLAGHIELDSFLEELRTANTVEAWSGAASIFAANLNEPKSREFCIRGLFASLNDSPSNGKVLEEMFRFFPESAGRQIGLDFLHSYFRAVTESTSEHGRGVHGVGDWLASVGVIDPEYTLTAIEVVLQYSTQLETWDGTPYTRLMTALFREAEERELSDQGQFLTRVVAVQDALLRLNMNSLDNWLKDAERP